jgi:hypothetical protein
LIDVAVVHDARHALRSASHLPIVSQAVIEAMLGNIELKEDIS